MNNAIQIANDRTTSIGDDLYQWAVDAEETIRRQDEQIESMRSMLLRWLNDAMTSDDVKTLEQKTLEILK